MASIYRFYDTDLSGKSDYDITGEAYRDLLEACFKYCSAVSFLAKKDCPNAARLDEKLASYRLPASQEIDDLYCHYGKFKNGLCCDGSYEIRCYRLSRLVRETILSVTDSIFKWTYWWGFENPDDLAFYRSDGSVFFFSIVHEGECTIYPRKNEDVNNILSHGYWIKMLG